MLTCKDATERLSSDLDGELSLRERLALRFHQFICADCKQAAQNMRALVTSMRDRPPSVMPTASNDTGPAEVADLAGGDGVAVLEAAESASPNAVDDAYIDRIMRSLAEQESAESQHSGPD